MTTRCWDCKWIDFKRHRGFTHYCNCYNDYRPLCFNCHDFVRAVKSKYVKPLIIIQFELF